MDGLGDEQFPWTRQANSTPKTTAKLANFEGNSGHPGSSEKIPSNFHHSMHHSLFMKCLSYIFITLSFKIMVEMASFERNWRYTHFSLNPWLWEERVLISPLLGYSTSYERGFPYNHRHLGWIPNRQEQVATITKKRWWLKTLHDLHGHLIVWFLRGGGCSRGGGNIG